MVVGAFPAVKLAVLLFKQISKPIANFAKERAKNNAFFRTYVCMPPAHFYNWCEVKSKMWIMNLGKPVNVPTLNEQMAIELGANLLGEGIIFILGAVVVIVEYNRSSKKETQKEEQRKEEFEQLNSTIRDLYFSVQKQQTQIHELRRTVYDLEHQVIKKPWAIKSDTQEPCDPPPSEPPGGTPVAPDLPQPELPTMNTPKNASTPYPDKGILMKSLNYLELSVLNMPQPEVKDCQIQLMKQPYIYRKPNLLNDALGYLEHDVKGIL